MASPIINDDVRGNPYRIRDPNNATYTEIWLVTAIVSVLGIRLYLYLTGYPQIGGGTLHIAHMLWGGLAMVIGFAMLILFAHPLWKPIATVVSGVGFGFFIDELGKFITNDNDYFFEPTVSIMYGVFIGLYLLARYFDRKRNPTEADHLYLAIEGVQWQAIGKLDEHRRDVALGHLDASGNTSPFADEVRHLLQNAELCESARQSRILSLRQRYVDLYWRTVGSGWVRRIVIGLFVVRVVMIAIAGLLVFWDGSLNVMDGLSWSEWLALGTGFVSGGLALYGLIQMLRRRRTVALHALAGSALISLFFGQFFAFAASQFAALGGLIIDLGVLGSLRLALSAENERHDESDDESEIDPREGIGQFL